MNDQLNQSGQLSNSQDGCQTNSQLYDSFTTGLVWSAIPSNSWVSCLVNLQQCTNHNVETANIRSPWNFVWISYVRLKLSDHSIVFARWRHIPRLLCQFQWLRLPGPRFFRLFELVWNLTIDQGRIQLVGGLVPSQGRNFGLKSGGNKLEAPKAPRIEMLKASRGMRNGERSWAVVELYHNL